MPTSTKTTKARAGTNPPRGPRFPTTARTPSAPARRLPTIPRSAGKPKSPPSRGSGLIDQARSALPGRTPAPKRGGAGLQEAVRGAFSRVRSSDSTPSATQSKKGVIGAVAGAGVGAAVVVMRRHRGKHTPDAPEVPDQSGNVEPGLTAEPEGDGGPPAAA